MPHRSQSRSGMICNVMTRTFMFWCDMQYDNSRMHVFGMICNVITLMCMFQHDMQGNDSYMSVAMSLTNGGYVRQFCRYVSGLLNLFNFKAGINFPLLVEGKAGEPFAQHL